MSADVADLLAVRLLALGTLVFCTAGLASAMGSPTLPALGIPTLIIDGALSLAALAILVRPRVAWPMIAFVATCGAATLLAAAAALPAAKEPTSWVPVAQMLAFSAAGLLYVSTLAQANVERTIGFGAFVLGATCALFGFIHLLNVSAIAGMIPGWIPFREKLPLVTGSILVAAAFGMIAPRSRAIAAIMVAAMFASWIAVLHVPRLWAHADDPGEWSFAGMALALVGTFALFISAELAARARSYDASRLAHGHDAAAEAECVSR